MYFVWVIPDSGFACFTADKEWTNRQVKTERVWPAPSPLCLLSALADGEECRDFHKSLAEGKTEQS